MNPTDLGLEYTGGINAPDAAVIGLPTFADQTGLNLTYGRAATPIARSAAGANLGNDSIDLVPYAQRFETSDATPVTLSLRVQMPPERRGVATVRVEYHALDTGSGVVHRWARQDFQLVGTLTAIGSVVEEKTPVDTVGIGGLSFTLGADYITVVLTGKAATDLVWLAKVRAEVYVLPDPIPV